MLQRIVAEKQYPAVESRYSIVHMIGLVAGKQRIVRIAFIVVVVAVPCCLVSIYAVVTSVGAPRLRSTLTGLSASAVLRSTVAAGPSTVSGSPRVVSITPSRCPGPPDTDTDVNRRACEPVLRGTMGWSLTPRRTVLSPTEYRERATDCDCFRSDLGYMEDTSEEEQRFPLAFSLLTYENLEQASSQISIL